MHTGRCLLRMLVYATQRKLQVRQGQLYAAAVVTAARRQQLTEARWACAALVLPGGRRLQNSPLARRPAGGGPCTRLLLNCARRLFPGTSAGRSAPRQG